VSNQTSFTPGPWYLRDKMRMFSDGQETAFCIDAAPTCCVADVWSDDDRAQANANLIAAAPEMYEALNEIFNELDGRYDGAPDSRVLWMGEHITRIRAALAKAVRP
jgi:hypothetical protein